MYQIPAILTVDVGNVIARFLNNIVRMGLIDPSNIHLMGHSLGAHVVGAAGAAFSLGKIGRITGERIRVRAYKIKVHKGDSRISRLPPPLSLSYRFRSGRTRIRKFRSAKRTFGRYRRRVRGRDPHDG